MSPQASLCSFLVLAAMALGVAVVPAQAQKQAKPSRIGFLSSGAAPGDKPRLVCLHQALRQLGWREGQNLHGEYRWSDGDPARMQTLASELASLAPDVLVAGGTPAALAMQRSAPGTPIVFVMVSDPVKSGLVASLNRPNGNITGISNFFPATVGKLGELLKMVAPGASRIAVPHDPNNAGKIMELRELRAIDPALGVKFEPVELRASEDVVSAFVALEKNPPYAIVTLSDGVTQRHMHEIIGHSARLKIPAIYQDSAFVQAGGLMSYGLNVCKHFARSAHHIDRILRGTKPADLPAELPTTFDFVINLKTAGMLGLALPPNVLALADEVIE